jgi:N-acetyl-1-D-myo-inositol-2-amino-2-deoxy-alpha-D-glucopyranoside deacetylase
MMRMRIWRIVGTVLVLTLVVVLYHPFLADLFFSVQNKNKIPFEMGDRILVIAPHPDDETLGGAGVIQKALAAGKKVKVLVMTNGDGFTFAVERNFHVLSPRPPDYRRLGEIRHQESLNALKRLGVQSKDVIFLGYPDGGMHRLWQTNWDCRHPYRALNGSTRSPYAFSYEKDAPYCGANVVKNLADILRDFRPTDIVYPDPHDQHPDHWATNAFVQYVMTERHIRAKEWTYLVHRGDFPAPWLYEPKKPLDPPLALSSLDTHWVYLPMNKEEEQKKEEAIATYITQVKVMDPFLRAFIRTNELLGTYDDLILPADRGNRELDLSGTNLPILVKDAVNDSVLRELEAEADLTAVGMVRTGGKFALVLETRHGISQNVNYAIRVRLFRSDGVKRLDLIVRNSHLFAIKPAENSMDLPAGSTVKVQGNRLWVMLPAGVLNGVTDLLISADTRVGPKLILIDKTAWRLIKVEK